MNSMVDVQAQIDALASGALVRPVPQLATLIVSGEERQSWLSGMLTGEVDELGIGQGGYTLAVGKNGRIRSEVWLALTDETVLLGVPADVVESLHGHMDGFLVMEDAEIEPSSTPRAWWLAHGPKAAEVAEAATREGATAVMGRYGEFDTALIIAERGASPTLADQLLAPAGVVLATPDGWNRIRIEHMLPRFGVDFGVENFPQEASLEGLAVSFNKGCYLGQEAVFMLQKRGHVNKRLVRLKLDAAVKLSAGDKIHDQDGAGVGEVTSAALTEDGAIAMGLVRYKQTISGTRLRVAGHDATVSCLSAREDCD